MVTPKKAKIQTLTTPDGSEQILPRTVSAAVSGLDVYAKVEDMNLKETPAGAQAKADIAEANAKRASRSILWLPSAAEINAIPTSQKGVANGVATLGKDGKVLAQELTPEAEKATLENGDNMVLFDSADEGRLKRLTWARIVATLKTALGSFFAPLVHHHGMGEVEGLDASLA